MRITILSVNVEHVTTSKGGYDKASVAYKDESGKVTGKNLVSFNNQAIFDIVRGLGNNDVVDVESAKDAGGFWQWTSVTKPTEGVSIVKASPVAATPAATPAASYTGGAAKNTYATKEERDQTQIYIVRQSAISSAVALANATGDKKATVASIISTAKEFEAFVFGKEFDNGSIEAMKGDEGDVL